MKDNMINHLAVFVKKLYEDNKGDNEKMNKIIVDEEVKLA